MECNCERKKQRSDEEVKGLINRLNRIEGQVRGLKRMVEDSAYCPDILTQSAAVTAALSAFNRELMSSHLRTCVVEDIKSGNDGAIDEVLSLMQKLIR